jgi:hypothetical protein
MEQEEASDRSKRFQESFFKARSEVTSINLSRRSV